MMLLYLAFGCVVAATSAVQLTKAKGDFMAAPLSLFGFGIAVIHGFMPALELSYDLRRFGNFSLAAHISSIALATASLGAAAFGLRVGARAFSRPHKKAAGKPSHETIWFVLLIALPGLYASFWLGQRFGLADLHVMQDRINAMADATFFLLLSGAAAVLPAYATQGGSAGRDRPRGFFVSLLLIAAISYFVLVTGSRNTVFIMVVCWFVALQAVAARADPEARTKFRSMQIGAICMMLLAGVGLAVFQEVRQLAMTGRTSTSMSELVKVENIVDGLAWNFGNHQGALWILDDDDDPKLYGRSYVAGLVILVPRSIWPDKPLGAGPTLKNLIHPGSYILGKRGIGSYTTGIMTEGLMNYSFLGPPLLAFLAGIFMAITRTYFFRSQSVTMRTACLYAMVSICITLLYSEFAGWFGRTVVVVGMLVVAATVASWFASPKANSRAARSLTRSAKG